MNQKRPLFNLLVATSALGLFSIVGCNETLPETFGVAPDQVTQPKIPKAQPKAQPKEPSIKVPRLITLELAGVAKPVRSEEGFAYFISEVADGQSVLRFTSYQDGQPTEHPKIMIRAKIDGTRIDDTIGQEVSARIFLQRKSNGPIMHTADGAPATIKLNALQGGWIGGVITSGVLIDTESGLPHRVTGKFGAKVQGAAASE